MSESRKRGDEFEAAIVVALEHANINPKRGSTIKKAATLKGKYEKLSVGKRSRYAKYITPKVQWLLSQAQNPTEYELASDNRGKKSSRTTTADIIIEADQDIYISCKHNNLSIKHQRPSGLPNQLGMNDDQEESFQNDYKTLNDYYYDKFEDESQYCNVSKQLISKMYEDFNELCERYIDNITEQQRIDFVKFLIGAEPNKYVFVWTGRLKVYSIKDVTFNEVKTHTKGNRLVLTLYNDDDEIATINMRIHTAKKDIRRTLDLKYDTKVEGDFEDLFEIC